SSQTLGNQDRSMKLSSDAFASRITVQKVGDPADSNTSFSFTLTQPGGEKCVTPFSLPADGSIHTCDRITKAGTFTITEILDASGTKWSLTPFQCTTIGDPPISAFTYPTLPLNAPSNSGTVSFNLDPTLQQDATCVFTNKHKPTLTLTKVVHNN